MNLLDGWETVGDSALKAVEHRQLMRKNAFHFGIDYFDDAMFGVFEKDLVLVGAQTGKGKTQLAMQLALSAAIQGKEVFFFALEAERYEIERRLVYTALKAEGITSHQFFTGYVSKELEEAERVAAQRLSVMRNFHIFYKRNEDFGPRDLECQLLALQAKAGCFIVDHFHFLDYDISKNEQEEHKKTIRKLRDIALDIGKPVVMVAHLNKAFSKSDREIVSIYDFYGTSDLANVCTKAITISSIMPKEVEINLKDCSATLLYVAKHRNDGSACAYYAICGFDRKSNTYSPGYYLFDMRTKQLVEPMRLPPWADRAIKQTPHQRQTWNENY